MICGIGIDVAGVDRLRKLLERHGEAFRTRIYSPRELESSAARQDDAGFHAGRWAAKEAAAKALGCGFGAECSPHEVEILNDAAGAPQLEFAGSAARRFQKLGAKRIHLSISHEREYAVAMVILES